MASPRRIQINRKLNILYLDIETAPNLGFTWGTYEQDVIDFVRPWYILSIAWAWNDAPVEVLALPDFASYKPEGLNSLTANHDGPLCRHIAKLLNKADIVVAQNGKAFDVKKINTRFFIHQIDPPAPYVVIDTLLEARKKFAFNSFKLDHMVKQLGEGEKIKHRGFEMWLGCMNGVMTDWADMKRYNKHDVVILRRLYKRELTWMNRHPAMHSTGCPKCRSKLVKPNGFVITLAGKFQRYKCMACRSWLQATEGQKVFKPLLKAI